MFEILTFECLKDRRRATSQDLKQGQERGGNEGGGGGREMRERQTCKTQAQAHTRAQGQSEAQ